MDEEIRQQTPEEVFQTVREALEAANIGGAIQFPWETGTGADWRITATDNTARDPVWVDVGYPRRAVPLPGGGKPRKIPDPTRCPELRTLKKGETCKLTKQVCPRDEKHPCVYYEDWLDSQKKQKEVKEVNDNEVPRELIDY